MRSFVDNNLSPQLAAGMKGARLGTAHLRGPDRGPLRPPHTDKGAVASIRNRLRENRVEP